MWMATSKENPLCQHCRFCNPAPKRRHNSRIRRRISRVSLTVPGSVHSWIHRLSSSGIQKSVAKVNKSLFLAWAAYNAVRPTVCVSTLAAAILKPLLVALKISFAWTSSALEQCSSCYFLSWLLLKFSLLVSIVSSWNCICMLLRSMLFTFFEWRNEMHDHFNEVGSVCECGVPILKIKVLMVMDFVNTFYILPTNLVYLLNQELSLLLWEYPNENHVNKNILLLLIMKTSDLCYP